MSFYPIPFSPQSPHQLGHTTYIGPASSDGGWYYPDNSTDSADVASPEVHPYWRGKSGPLPGSKTPIGPVQLRPSTDLEPLRNTVTIKFSDGTSLKSSKPGKSPVKERHVNAPADSATPFGLLDKYADVFIPQYLQNIQLMPHTIHPLPALPQFPPASYSATFCNSSITPPCRISNILSTPPPNTNTHPPPPISIEMYGPHWKLVLGWELDQLERDKREIVLWLIGVRIYSWEAAEFTLHVPSIRENYPRLEIGDIVHMREIYKLHQRGSGIAFEGRVLSLRKREGIIHLFCPSLRTHIQRFIRPDRPIDYMWQGYPLFTPEDVLPLSLNITFLLNVRPITIMDVAAATMADALLAAAKMSKSEPDFARNWLFPSALGAESMVNDHRPQPIVEYWVDPGLNDEQRFAVTSVAYYHSRIPQIIYGPAGTGKTRTLVEAVLQIIHVDPEACVLLCAPSNPATDTLALRLRDTLKPDEMLRLNDQNRTFQEVPVAIMQYCYIENDVFSIPKWDALLKYRVVVCSCFDASILVTAKCTNSVITQMENKYMSAFHPYRKRVLATPHWTHLLIDEAAQGSEPELLIPISVVAPLEINDGDGAAHAIVGPQLVLCGDPNQLGSIVTSEAAMQAELDVSLLERLLERDVYSSKEMDSKPNIRAPVTRLVKNYRSHPVILMPPSAIFYDDSLQPCAKNGTVTWSSLSNPDLPMMFIGNASNDECVDERASWYNTGEIDKIVEIIQSLLSESAKCSPPLAPVEIGVMAPFREQVWKLRERLRKESLNAVDVGTVEDYQGRESRVVLLSCVRSRARFCKEDAVKRVGLFMERKRMNVAITRAKELLVIVGNGALLQHDPYWKSVLQFCTRNKLYVGPELELPADGSYISKLESHYFETALNGNQVVDEEEKGVMLAGGIARDILQE